MKLLLLAALALRAWAGAPACTPIDLRAQLGAARDQSPTSWCFANSAADLVTQALGARVSAFQLATSYHLASEARLFRSRDPGVQDYLARHPEFHSRLRRWRLDYPQGLRPANLLTLDGLANIGGMDDDAILLAGTEGYCRDERIPGGEAAQNAALRAIQGAYVRRARLFDGFRTGPIGEITEPASRVAAHVFRDWVRAQCGPLLRPREALIPGSFYAAGDLREYRARIARGELRQPEVSRAVFRLIDRQLERGHAVAVGIDANELYEPDPSSGDGDHSSVIAARRPFADGCRYFLRVHYGNTCDFRGGLNSLCEENEGGVWVRAEDVPSIYAALWVERGN